MFLLMVVWFLFKLTIQQCNIFFALWSRRQWWWYDMTHDNDHLVLQSVKDVKRKLFIAITWRPMLRGILLNCFEFGWKEAPMCTTCACNKISQICHNSWKGKLKTLKTVTITMKHMCLYRLTEINDLLFF